MAENTAIEWCDKTFNPWRGCTHALLPDGTPHPGCLNCYAEAGSKRAPKILGVWGDDGNRVVAAESYWQLPFKWNKVAALECAKCGQQGGTGEPSHNSRPFDVSYDFECIGCGSTKYRIRRQRVFCASFADIFEDWDGTFAHPGNGDRITHDHAGWGGYPHGPIGMSEVRARLFALIDATPNLDWIILTKRPQNVRRMWPRYTYDACATGDCPHDRQSECRVELYRENVWLLTSISDQQSADAMIPPLLECRDLVPVLGVSAEPLVGPIDRLPIIHRKCGGFTPDEDTKQFVRAAGAFTGQRTLSGEVCGKGEYLGNNVYGRGFEMRSIYCPHCGYAMSGPQLDWVIVGGESGPHARPMHPDWARSLRDQCQAAGVAYFHKQNGEWYPIHGTGRPSRDEDSEQFPFCWVSRDGGVSQSGCEPDALMLKIGKKAAGRTLDCRTWDEFPQVAGARS